MAGRVNYHLGSERGSEKRPRAMKGPKMRGSRPEGKGPLINLRGVPHIWGSQQRSFRNKGVDEKISSEGFSYVVNEEQEKYAPGGPLGLDLGDTGG